MTTVTPATTENGTREAATEARPPSPVTAADRSEDTVGVAVGDRAAKATSLQDVSAGAQSSGANPVPVSTNLADALGSGNGSHSGNGSSGGDAGKDSGNSAKPLHLLDKAGGAADFAATATSFASAQPVTATTNASATQRQSGVQHAQQGAQAQPLHQQVSGGILELRARGDGTHRMLLEMHPVDLGQVTVEVRMHAGALTINLSSFNEAARHSIQQALPQLRAELADVGLSNASISVGADTSGNSSQQGSDRATQSHRPHEGASESRPTAVQMSTSSVRSSTHTGVDRWL